MLVPAMAGADPKPILKPSVPIITREAITGSDSFTYEAQIDNAVDLAGFQFDLYSSPAAFQPSAAIGSWWAGQPGAEFDTDIVGGDRRVLEYLASGQTSGSGSVAHLTVNYGGIPPGSYTLAFVNTELVKGNADLIDHDLEGLLVEIVAPGPPSPDPMTWEVEPHALDQQSIHMIGSEATDISGVEYQFKADGVEQTPQPAREWTQIGLGVNTRHTYRVRARDLTVDHNATQWSVERSAYTLANPLTAGALIIDTTTGQLNSPACRSLGLVSVGLNGNPAYTPIAIKVQGGKWLRFYQQVPSGRTDIKADSDTAEWYTAAEWAGKRIRGLDPDTEYVFEGKTKNGGDAPQDAAEQETPLVVVGTYRTTIEGDVSGNGYVNVLDVLRCRDAALIGGVIGINYAWATDVDDSGVTNVVDVLITRDIALQLGP